MAEKVIEIQHTAEKLKQPDLPGMWDDYLISKQPFSQMSEYRNDFHEWVADAWTVTEVGTSLQVLTDQRNGVLRLTSGGTENDGNNLQLGGSGDSETVGECFAPAAGTNLYFEARIKSDDVTEHDFFLGLSVQDTAVVASLGQAVIGFFSDDGSTGLDCYTRAASVSSVDQDVHTLVNDTYVKVGFKVTGTQKVEFYVNDVLKSTLTANIPTELMKLTIAQLTGEGNAASLDIDYIIVAQTR